MNYIEFTAGNKEYKLRLGVGNIVALEKKLGCNPMAIFGTGDTIPTVTQMVAILHASLQKYNSGISLADAEEIFEAWLEDGNTSVDFIGVIIDVYKVSGIISGEVEDTKN